MDKVYGPSTRAEARVAARNEKRTALAESLTSIMCAAALKAKARFEDWNQYLLGGNNTDYDVWVGDGNCFGLSATFLAMEKDKEDFVKKVTLDTLGFARPSGQSALASEIVHATIKGNQNKNAKPNSNQEKLAQEYMLTKGLEYLGTETFKDATALFGKSNFAKYVGSSNYFYKVSVRGHAMAVAANKGRKVFFDPNAGLAICLNMKQLSEFCENYFTNDLVISKYGTGARVSFTVNRYAAL